MGQLNVVSLFSGAGGLDYGLEAAGFDVRVAIDNDNDSCATLRRNRNFPVINKNIHETSTKEILDSAGLRQKEVDIIIGGPPCQPFSKSGYWVNGDTKRLKDPRALTLNEFMRCVEDMLPVAFFFENVHGISYSGKEEGFRLLEKLAERINTKKGTNYRLFWKVINMADYGVPQIRKRFFLAAHREGKVFRFPKPTHSPSNYVTAWDAIGGFPLPMDEELKARGRWAGLLPSIPEGENYLWHTERKGGVPLFGWRTRYWSFLLKLAKNQPSWTIQAQPGPAIGPFHWENRRLSVDEMSRLQTFPKGIRFVGSRISIQKQIGNAVPSLMSEILSREISKQFFDTSVKGPLTFKIKPKRPIPSPEPIQPIDEKYLSLVKSPIRQASVAAFS